jgi:hypothetical protein
VTGRLTARDARITIRDGRVTIRDGRSSPCSRFPRPLPIRLRSVLRFEECRPEQRVAVVLDDALCEQIINTGRDHVGRPLLEVKLDRFRWTQFANIKDASTINKTQDVG